MSDIILRITKKSPFLLKEKRIIKKEEEKMSILDIPLQFQGYFCPSTFSR